MTLQERLTLLIQRIAQDVKFFVRYTHIDLFYTNGAWEPIPSNWNGKIHWFSAGFPDAPQPPMRAGDLWYRQE